MSGQPALERLEILWRKLEDEGRYVCANTVSVAMDEIRQLRGAIETKREEVTSAGNFAVKLRHQAKWIDDATASNRLAVPDNHAITLEDVDTDELRAAADELDHLQTSLFDLYAATNPFMDKPQNVSKIRQRAAKLLGIQ